MLSNQIRTEAEQMKKQMTTFIASVGAKAEPTASDIVFMAQAIRRVADMLAREAGGRD